MSPPRHRGAVFRPAFPPGILPTLMPALAIAGLASLSACRNKAAEEPKAERGEKEGEKEKGGSLDRVALGEEAFENLKLVLATAEETELAPSIEVAAELVPDPDRRADVGARGAARVVEFKVRLGDHVQRGAPLVILASVEVGRARAELHAARAKSEVALQSAERERALFAAKATSQRELAEAEAAARTTSAELKSVQTTLAALGAAEEVGGDPSLLVLRSPIAGTVVARPAHVGQSVEPSATLVSIVDLDRLWLQAEVYERELRLVAPGRPVLVEVRAFPGESFGGKVDRIGDILDEKTRAVKVFVTLRNPGRRLKPGMFATARILGGPGAPGKPGAGGTGTGDGLRVLAIPWASLQEIDDHPAVFVRKGERGFELRRVHTGRRAGSLIEILNGVKPGDEVVAEGSFLLKGELLKSTLGGED